MSMFGKLRCWYAGGHLRGKKIDELAGEMYGTMQRSYTVYYACPRCGATWTRKIKRIEKVPTLTLDIRNAG